MFPIHIEETSERELSFWTEQGEAESRLTDSGSVERDIDEHSGENQRRELLVQPSVGFAVRREFSTGTERQIMEGDSGDDESSGHPGYGPTGDTTSTDFVDDDECDESEEQTAELVRRG
jgi:hypothetical protein